MANNRTSSHAIPNDFALVLDANFQQLNSLPSFDVEFLDKEDDWYLLCFLKEQQRNGHSYEVTLAGLNAIIGALSDESYFYNPVNNSIGFLNQNHHLLGESASNKSSICQEVSAALQSVINSFPDRYSSAKRNPNNENDDNDQNIHMEKNKNKSQEPEYSLVVSNTTEVALLTNLAKINTILLHSDGDVALGKLGYYEQGKNETSGGVSLFCDASDGIRGGFIRGTGVLQIKINRPVALFNMFVASTGTKLTSMLQRFHETRIQDGVFGRVFFTWCQSINELPKMKSKSFTHIPSFPHFAHSVTYFFKNQLQFRYMADKADVAEINSECIDYEERLLEELKKQNITTPATYAASLTSNDIREDDYYGSQSHNHDTSSFKLLASLINDWWKSSNSSEKHLKSIYRKVVNMLSKCIWSMKVIRIIFRLMSKNLKYIDQKQGDRLTSNLASIDVSFQHAMERSINNFLLAECQRIDRSKWIIWSNINDVTVGYTWYLRKMLVVENLLTLQPLNGVINERLGKKPTEKSQKDCKLDKAKTKVLNFPVVFFSRTFLTNKRQGVGSGQFCHSTDMKPDEVLSTLIDDGLLIGGNFIKNVRSGKEDLQYSSFCKQFPSTIKNNPRIEQTFERLGLDMSRYEKTFEHQYLPMGNEFTDEAIQFMKLNDEFVQYYHNYYKEDDRFQSFREMVHERVRLGEIIPDKNNSYSSGRTPSNNQQNEHIQKKQMTESNKTLPKIVTNTTNGISIVSCDEIDDNNSLQSMTDQLVQSMVEEAPLDYDPVNANTTTTNEHSYATSTNLTTNITGNEQMSAVHDILDSIRGNSSTESSMEYSFQHRSITYETTASSISIGPASASVSNGNHIVTNDEQLDDDEQFDSINMTDKSSENELVDNSMSIDERNSTYEPMLSNTGVVLTNVTNNMNRSSTNSNDQDISKTKGRGRPSKTNITSKWSTEEVDNLILNPKSVTWKSIILKRQFIIGTSTDLFKMIPSRLFDEKSRFKIIDYLILKNILIKGDWFRNAKGDSINGFLKGSPTDPQVAINLVDFGIDIQEYKLSLNPNQNIKRQIDGKIINQSYLFSNVLQEQIDNDEWFKQNMEINERFIYTTSTLNQTTSNYQIDEFQQQRKEKAQRTLINKRKKVEELQEETTNICGTDMPVKRQRKPKIRDD
ncbi:hypothetical protein I4U23_031569 [Adineta vaga]|nr:hypothetical protein I4U23_031569 [Adineta vaga]